MVINMNGISFYENIKRDKVILKIQFEDVLYAMGSGKSLKFAFISRGKDKNFDAKMELYTCNGQSARVIAEDIISYCQLKLAETTKNDCIEIVKRNLINIFEDMVDPYLIEDDSPSHLQRLDGSTLRTFNR